MSFLTGHWQMMTKKRLTEQVSRFLLSYFFSILNRRLPNLLLEHGVKVGEVRNAHF